MFSQSRSKRRTLITRLSYLFIIVVLILVLFPIYWMFASAIKPVEDLFVIPPQWIPSNPTVENTYSVIYGDYERSSLFPRYFLNSVIVTAGTTALSLLVSTLAAYAISRYPFRGSGGLMVSILSTQMFPQGMLLISLYLIFLRMNLLNTYPALILANTTFAIPFSIWMLKGFFDTIPTEIEDAARVDGATRLVLLTRIVLPLMAPGLIAAGIYTFLIAWDEYLFAAILTTSPEMRTLPPGIVQSFVGQFYLNWPNVMAASVLVTIPVTLLFIFLQKYLVQGLTVGAVKG
ncbi:MAG: carbohydrate ABC transporter permease [Proteobacteria bacterium]|nr:carbohydrate ABC transporter permease [Pseudomonadota bacterium]